MTETLTVQQILSRVRRIQLVANRSVDELFAGQYRSVFRGQGIEFDEVREYQPGDDIRSIDWNVTARSGHCFVKRFAEERELTVLFLMDVSASGMFGSASRTKLDLLTEVVALLMFSALKNNDRVGLVTFGEQIEEFFPPRKGKAHVLHLIRELVSVQPVRRPTHLVEVLQFLNRVQKRRAVVFLVSDLLDRTSDRLALHGALRTSGRRHDLTVIRVNDPRESELPNVGFLQVTDPETGEWRELNTRSKRVRDDFRNAILADRQEISEILKRSAIDELPVNTVEDYLPRLRRFFRQRERVRSVR